MNETPDELRAREASVTMRFSRDHQWIRVDGDVGTVGITDYAQSQLADVISVELPETGRKANAGDTVAAVESVKAASDVFTPVAGEVVEVNDELAGQPALVNTDAEGKAWFFKIRLANVAELGSLMDRTAYRAFVRDIK
jgi:glycine cleavage system H protein